MSIDEDDAFSYDTSLSSSSVISYVHKNQRRSSSVQRRSSSDHVREFQPVKLNLVKESIVDVWKDCSPSNRVSIQFQIETGLEAYSQLGIRVSADGCDLVIEKEISPYITDSNLALVVPKVDERIPNHFEQLLGVLKHHPRVIARKCSVKSLLKGKNRASCMNWRIPLPYKCRKEFATDNDGDEWFHGAKMIDYSNGEMRCHVELIAHKNEGYNRFAPEVFDIKLCYEKTEKEMNTMKKEENDIPEDISFENSSLQENAMHGNENASAAQNSSQAAASAQVSFHTAALDATKGVYRKPSSSASVSSRRSVNTMSLSDLKKTKVSASSESVFTNKSKRSAASKRTSPRLKAQTGASTEKMAMVLRKNSSSASAVNTYDGTIERNRDKKGLPFVRIMAAIMAASSQKCQTISCHFVYLRIR